MMQNGMVMEMDGCVDEHTICRIYREKVFAIE